MNEQLHEAAAIRAARARQTRAMADRDLDAVAALWTEDVTMRRGLGQAVAGRSEYLAMVAAAATGADPLTYQRLAVSVDVSDCWALAYEDGRWSGHLGGADGVAVIGGRYGAQWVKRDGRWLIRAEVFVALTGAGAGLGYQAVK